MAADKEQTGLTCAQDWMKNRLHEQGARANSPPRSNQDHPEIPIRGRATRYTLRGSLLCQEAGRHRRTRFIYFAERRSPAANAGTGAPMPGQAPDNIVIDIPGRDPYPHDPLRKMPGRSFLASHRQLGIQLLINAHEPYHKRAQIARVHPALPGWPKIIQLGHQVLLSLPLEQREKL